MNEATDYERKALTLAGEAEAFLVADQASYEDAGSRLLVVVALRREIVEHHAPMKKKAYDAWQEVIAAEKRLLDPVAAAERCYKARIATWEVQQRVIEAEKRARAEAEARRLAEEARERELEQAEAQGADAAEVAAMATAPLPLVMPVVEPQFQPVRGISTATNWKGEVTHLLALVKAIAAGEASLSLISPNETAINQLARATRGTLVVPGVRFYEVSTVRAGRR